MKGIPREVGSLKQKQFVTNSRSLRILRERLALDSRQEAILVGTLLGDAHLECSGWNTKYRLQLVQGDAQKEYLFWKFEQFRHCCASAPSYQRWNDLKFNLKTTINKDKQWWRLYIGTKSQDDFTRLVSPYIIEAMRYKLRALDPVETTRRPLT